MSFVKIASYHGTSTIFEFPFKSWVCVGLGTFFTKMAQAMKNGKMARFSSRVCFSHKQMLDETKRMNIFTGNPLRPLKVIKNPEAVVVPKSAPAKKKKRRKNKKKDPNAPIGIRNAYIFFLNDGVRESIMAENPAISFGALSKIAAERYRALSENEKEKYLIMANDDKQRYEKQLQEYKAGRKVHLTDLLQDSNIAPTILQFLGVRSLVRVTSCSKSIKTFQLLEAEVKNKIRSGHHPLRFYFFRVF